MVLGYPPQVYDWQEGAAEPTLQYECRLANASKQLSHERALFLQASQHCSQQQHEGGEHVGSELAALMAAARQAVDEPSTLGSTFELQLESRCVGEGGGGQGGHCSTIGPKRMPARACKLCCHPPPCPLALCVKPAPFHHRRTAGTTSAQLMRAARPARVLSW